MNLRLWRNVRTNLDGKSRKNNRWDRERANVMKESYNKDTKDRRVE